MRDMANTTMKISLPSELRTAAKRLSEKKQYSTVSGFVQHLIRREDALDREHAKLREMIQQGLDYGISETSPDVFFEQLERRVRAKNRA